MIKKAVLILVICVVNFSFSVNKKDTKIIKFSISYQSNPTAIPERYEIIFSKKKAYQIPTSTSIPPKEREKKKIKLNNKQWKSLYAIIDEINLSTLSTSNVHTKENTPYHVRIEYSDKTTKNIRFWNKEMQTKVIRLHKLLVEYKSS